MNKQEFIAKYGEDAWARKREQSRLWHKQKYDNDPEHRAKKKAQNTVHHYKWRKSQKDYENAASKKCHKKRYAIDPAYREYMRANAKKSRLNLKNEMGDLATFVATQIHYISLAHIEDSDKYILENLTREAA